MDEYIKNLYWRYATKKFDTTKHVSDDDMRVIVDAGRLAPSSYGLEPWKFIVVTDPRLRERLREVGNNQPQITDSSHLIVLCARTDMTDDDINELIMRTRQIRNTDEEKLEKFRSSLQKFRAKKGTTYIENWTKRQLYIALGFMLSAAAHKQIDACPMEGFESKGFNEVLGLEGYTATVLCALGYRSDSDETASRAKVRRDFDQVVEFR